MKDAVPSKRSRTVGLLLFPGFEPLDAFGPVEVLVASRFPGQGEERPFPFRILTLAETEQPVPMTGGPRVVPDCALADCPPLHLLLVPGGDGTRSARRNASLLAFLREQARRVEVLASICTGAALLGAAGLLDGVEATTNRRAFAWVQSVAPGAVWDREARWVDSGAIVTAAGISAGTDMALHLVDRLLGREAAEATACRMEYRWDTGTRTPS